MAGGEILEMMCRGDGFVLLSRDGDRTLIISVDAIQRSLAVRVEG